ncbi:MAG: TIGR02281 family clan AA aspartic protease [Pseudomonadota bacterium]
MAPWISLVLLVLAGLGLILRHDMLPVLGFDLGLASAATAAAGVILFTATRATADDRTAGPLDSDLMGLDDRPSGFARQLLIVVTSTVALVGGLTLADVTTRPSAQTAGGNSSDFSAHGRPGGTLTDTPAPGGPIGITRSGHRTGRIALVVMRGSDGIFTAAARLNRHPTKLAIDTGAARVLLTTEDARRSGVDLARAAYTVPVETSAGTLYAAPVTLARVDVGPLGASNIPALVAQPGKLAGSLLGMSFLKRLGAYTVSGDIITLESRSGIRLSRDRAVHTPDAARGRQQRVKDRG